MEALAAELRTPMRSIALDLTKMESVEALRALLDQVLSETVSNEKNTLLQRLAQMDAENTEKMEPCSKKKDP